MKFSADLRKFIKNHSEDFNVLNPDYTTLYSALPGVRIVSEFSQLLYLAKINPLLTMNTVPAYFLYNDTFVTEGLDLVLPEGIHTVDIFAFKNSCVNTLTCPSTLKIINAGAFQNCPYLYEIHLNHNIADIESNAFSGCSNLRDVYYDGTYEELLAKKFVYPSLNFAKWHFNS